MEEETKDFFDLIKTLKKTGYDANGVLYGMCEGDTLLGEESGKLAGKIWLIGRSYAASPERRHYIFDESFEKISNPNFETNKKCYPKIIQTSGDGTANFFEKIEDYLKKDKSADKVSFNTAFKILKDLSFTFDNNNTDKEKSEDKSLNDTNKTILNNMIKSVYYFNKILVRAVEKFDVKNDRLKQYYNDDGYEKNKDKVRCKNFISFCSKFLHFHCPNTVFIYDGYSLAGGNILFDKKSRKQNDNKQITFCGKNINIDISAIDCNLDFTEDSGNDIKTVMADYIKHVTHAYSLMKFLHDDKLKDGEMKLTPRLVDDIFLRIKKVGAINAPAEIE